METEKTDYAKKLIHILNSEFSDWEAHREGIIDDKGNLLKVPTEQQKKAVYTDMHVIVRALKRTMDALGKDGAMPNCCADMQKVSEIYNIPMEDLMEDPYIKEAMVVGDGQYAANNIASGDVSGSIVGGVPGNSGKPLKKLKKKRAIIKQ